MITDEEDAHSPRWKCLGCGEFKSGGAGRITNHLLGLNGSKKCSGTIGDDVFKAALDKVKAGNAEKAVAKAGGAHALHFSLLWLHCLSINLY